MSPLHYFSTRRPLLSALQVAFLVGLVIGGASLQALAQSYVPPDVGLPGRREGGGTRGCWNSGDSTTRISEEDNLAAVVPTQNIGYTLSGYPTFFVYVPQFYGEHAVAAQFVLRDGDENELYKATFQTSKTSGIVSISLPANANLPSLEVGKQYNWSFTLLCDPGDDRSADVVVDSWIQRIEPSAALQQSLEQATPTQLPTIYAQNGIWYDALSSLVNLQDQRDIATQWINLLNSVELDRISHASFIGRVHLDRSNQTVSNEHSPSPSEF